MARYSLRLPDDLHRKASEIAKEQDVSMNQFFLYAISQMVATLQAQKIFSKFDVDIKELQTQAQKVLEKVADRPVLLPDDEI